MVAEDQANEAVERLNRGIQESRHMVQHQTMELAQEYFGDSVEAFKQQLEESRATLEGLPGQIPGGQEEPFQVLFQELMENYARIEEALDEARKNVADLDTEQLRRQGEVEASDAARREARERGVDLTEVEGTGSGGRIIIGDVQEHAEAIEDAEEEEPEASEAAGRNAAGLSVDPERVTDTAEGAKAEAAGLAEQVADRIGGAVEGAVEEAEQITERDGVEEPRATNAAKRKAEELGVDLSTVKGSGAEGLITIRDIVKP